MCCYAGSASTQSEDAQCAALGADLKTPPASLKLIVQPNGSVAVAMEVSTDPSGVTVEPMSGSS